MRMRLQNGQKLSNNSGSADQVAEKNKEKFHQKSATVKQPKAESGLNKQLLRNLQAELFMRK